MRYIKYILVSISLISIFITGCAILTENEDMKIEVSKRINDENNYEDFKVVTNNEQVQKASEIIDNIDWEKAKVDMARPADYNFSFQYKNPEIEAKSALFELWISPNKDKVELVIDAESKYAKLNQDKSTELYEIITGEKLSDQK